MQIGHLLAKGVEVVALGVPIGWHV